MKNLTRKCFAMSRVFVFFCLFAVVTAGFLTIDAQKSYAQAFCDIRVEKLAIPSDGTEFHFVLTGIPGRPGFDLLSGDSASVSISGGDTVSIVEELPAGWVLTDVQCEADVQIVDIENGIEIFCSPPNGGAASCRFINTLQAHVPTLSEWGMIAAAAGLMVVGIFFAMRRRKTQAV